MGFQALVITLGRGTEGVGQTEHGLVDVLAKDVKALQPLLVRAALHVHHARADTAFLVDRADIGRQTHGGFAHVRFAVEGVFADDAGAAFGVQRDQFQARLDVASDMLHRSKTTPGDDFLEVLRLVQALLERLVATFPVGDTQVFGQRMVRGHVDHGAGDGQCGERVIGRCLDDRIAAQDHVADDGPQRQRHRVAGDDVQGARTEAAHFKLSAVEQGLRHPAFQVVDTDGTFGHLPDQLTRQQVLQAHIGALDDARGGRRSQVRQLAGFLQVPVFVQGQAFAERHGIIENVLEAQAVQIRKLGRVAQRQLVDVLVGIGGEEAQVTAAATHFNQVVGDHLTTNDHRCNGVGHDSALQGIEEVHRFAMGLFGRRAGDLVVAAVLFAVTLDRPDDIATVASTAAGCIPFDGHFVAGDEATPMDVGPQIEERRTPGLAPVAR
ncbi:hypothetical protein D3C81_1127280 [compost metagenome]